MKQSTFIPFIFMLFAYSVDAQIIPNQAESVLKDNTLVTVLDSVGLKGNGDIDYDFKKSTFSVFKDSVYAGIPDTDPTGEAMADKLRDYGFPVYSIQGDTFSLKFTTNSGTFSSIDNPSYNVYEGGSMNYILGGRSNSFPNKLLGDADLRYIYGYDNTIGESIASGVLSMHSSIETSNTGHNWIFGGSLDTVSQNAGYSVMIGGLDNNLDGAFNNVLSGNNISLKNTGRSFLGTGLNSSIISSGTNQGFIIAENSSITNGTDFFAVSAENSTFTNVNGGFASYCKDCEAENVNHIKLSGFGAKATNNTQEVRASGYFSEAGDAQVSKYILKRDFTSSSFQELRLNQSFSSPNTPYSRVEIKDGQAVTFTAYITVKSDDFTKIASYKVEGFASRNGALSIHSYTKTVLHETDTNWDIDVISVSDSLVIRVKTMNETVRAVCELTCIELK